ncbi:MAG TPA: hypothetical protein VET30_05375, partial [Pseudoxanthomonas sp.]|nr:hypothetical protein [Pseudoxanthomonas sp.]
GDRTAAAEPLQVQQPSSPASAGSWILPGDFGPGTTLQELQQRFGAGNASARDIPGAEGESFRGVVLFPDDPTRRATLYFQDQENLRSLSMVSVDEAASQWKLASGIGIGTSLAELQQHNGKPFTFSGFDWDYGGTITDWHGGKLQPANDNAVSERMQLRMPEGGSGNKPYPMGDSGFASDDPRWTDLGITVGGISVGFPGEDDL